jgi:hypothetical protein
MFSGFPFPSNISPLVGTMSASFHLKPDLRSGTQITFLPSNSNQVAQVSDGPRNSSLHFPAKRFWALRTLPKFWAPLS